jgi:hypothetical protein
MAAPNTVLNRESHSVVARNRREPQRKFRDAFADLETAHEEEAEMRDIASGTLSVRSNDTSGMATLAAGHGIATGQLFNVEWSGGGRSEVVAGTVDGQNVPFSGGTGSVLPAQDTAVSGIHMTTLAERGGYVGDDGNASASAACIGFNETASMIGICRDAIKQHAARMVDYSTPSS